MRYLLFRMFQWFEAVLARWLPAGRIKDRIMSALYHVLYTVPVGTIRFTYFDGTQARFYRFLSMSQAVPGNGEEVEQYLRQYTLKEDDYVVDAGAWPGDFAIYAAKKVGPRGRVLCFEPNPFNRKILKKNLRLNRIGNIDVIDKGIWSGDGRFRFLVAGKHSGLTSLAYKQSPLELEVDVTSVDDELARRRLDHIDLIKMDIEGAEVEAVKGCQQLMNRYPVHFTISSHHPLPGGTRSYQELEQLFRSMGYDAITVANRITYAQLAKA